MFTLRFKLLCVAILFFLLAGLAFNQVLLNKRVSDALAGNQAAFKLNKDTLDLMGQLLVSPTASPSASPTPVLAVTLAPKASSRSAVPSKVVSPSRVISR